MERKKAAVIGSGIGGLASAIRLAAKGYEVKVFEKAPRTGGKLSELRKDGFRFDRGPSVLTLPWLINELFELCGEDPGDHFAFQRLEMSCRYFWEDGSILNAWQDISRFTDEIADKFGVPPERIKGFFKKSRELYELTAESFLFRSLHKAGNYLSGEFVKTMLNAWKLDPFITMHDRNKRWFSDKRIVQMFDRYATYNGSDPYKTPATLNIIAHLEHSLGTFFPERGIYQIAASLTALAERTGVMFELNSEVTEIIHASETVKGIRTASGFSPADIVVCDADVNHLYESLLPAHKIPARLLGNERSTSALIFLWGIRKENPSLELHNILFSDNYPEEFRHLFTCKSIYKDPTVYIYISSRIVSGDAPQGSENWYVMINAPEDAGQDWDTIIPEARSNIIAKINRMLGCNIEKEIIMEDIAGPRTIERETGSYKGSLYGLSSNSKFAAFNRHPNFTKKFRNLYFTGGSVHPGGGMPLCLASARIIDREIEPLPSPRSG